MADLVTLEDNNLGGCHKCGKSGKSGNTININVQGATANAVNAGAQPSTNVRPRPQGLSPEVLPVAPAQTAPAQTTPAQPAPDTATPFKKLEAMLKQALDKANRPPAEGLSPNVVVKREVVQKPYAIPTVINRLKKVFTQKPVAIATERRVVDTVQKPVAIATERRVVDTVQKPVAIPTDRRVKQVVNQDKVRVIDRIKNRWIIVRQNQPQPPPSF